MYVSMGPKKIFRLKYLGPYFEDKEYRNFKAFTDGTDHQCFK